MNKKWIFLSIILQNLWFNININIFIKHKQNVLLSAIINAVCSAPKCKM